MIHFTCPAFVFLSWLNFVYLYMLLLTPCLFPFLTLVSFLFLLECIPVHPLFLPLGGFCCVHTFRQDKLLFIIQHTLCFPKTAYILGRIYTNCLYLRLYQSTMPRQCQIRCIRPAPDNPRSRPNHTLSQRPQYP